MLVFTGTHETNGPYSLIVLHVYVVQPAEVIVSLQEAGQLLVSCDWLRQELPSLAFLHVPTEQEVGKVLENPKGLWVNILSIISQCTLFLILKFLMR